MGHVYEEKQNFFFKYVSGSKGLNKKNSLNEYDCKCFDSLRRSSLQGAELLLVTSL